MAQPYSWKVDRARVNLFAFPHKSFRFMWLEVVQVIGSGDYTTAEGFKRITDMVAFAIKHYTTHNKHESDFFAPLLKAKGGDAAKVVADWITEHDEHAAGMNILDTLVKAIVAEKDLLKRKALNADLYERASFFLIEDLKHMHWEENVVMGAFQAHFTDAELHKIEENFLKNSMSPEEMQELTPLFLRAGNIDDRSAMLFAIKVNAPAAALDGILNGLAATIIPAGELETIKRRLAAPPSGQTN